MCGNANKSTIKHMKVTLTQVKTYTTKKDGSPLIGKYGPYVSVQIKTKEHGEAIISGVAKKAPVWNIGDVIEIEVTERVSDGKTYLNFSLPKTDMSIAELSAAVKKLQAEMAKVIDMLEPKDHTQGSLEDIAFE